MSGIDVGRYRIRLIADPDQFVGVDAFDNCPPALPVVSDGWEKTWIIRKLPDGNFLLTLELPGGTQLFIRDDAETLVADIIPSPNEWVINGLAGGPYTIEVPSPIIPTRAWTLADPARKIPVTLEIMEIPTPNQKWDITLVEK